MVNVTPQHSPHQLFPMILISLVLHGGGILILFGIHGESKTKQNATPPHVVGYLVERPIPKPVIPILKPHALPNKVVTLPPPPSEAPLFHPPHRPEVKKEKKEAKKPEQDKKRLKEKALKDIQRKVRKKEVLDALEYRSEE